MAKDDKTILWIIGIILLIVILSNLNMLKKEEEFSIKVHYYKDGVEVFPKKSVFSLFSIITPPGGSYDQISFDIVGTNTGNVQISNMQIVDATPQVFFSSLPTTSSSLAIGESKTLWSSGILDASQFEVLIQPVNFWVKIRGVDSTGTLSNVIETSLSLTFEAEGNYLIVDSPITLGGNQEYTSVIVYPYGIIYIDPSIGWLNITARGEIIIQGKIDGLGSGYAGGVCDMCGDGPGIWARAGTSGNGPGGGVYSTGFFDTYHVSASGAGGASHASVGTVGGYAESSLRGGPGATYGSSSSKDLEIGSGGGGGGCAANSGRTWSYGGGGGGGGGAVGLNAPIITIENSGIINVNGNAGRLGAIDNSAACSSGGGGGGSGGTILLDANDLIIEGNLEVRGGGGGTCRTYGSPDYTYCGHGGGGGDGRIKLFYSNTINTASGTFNYGAGSYYTQQI